MKDSRISLRDEALLGWYFCEGLSVFERSTFGALLERQEQFAFASETCQRCQGVGLTQADLTRSKERIAAGSEAKDVPPMCHRCEGTGLVSSGRVQSPRAAEHCRACASTGADRHGDDCAQCGGTGVRNEYDLRVKVGEEGEPSYTPDDSALRRYAVASRILSRMKPRHAAPLEAFYGLCGLRCGAGNPWDKETDPVAGRLFSLYPLTKQGRRWIATLENKREVPAIELLMDQWVVQRQQPMRERQDKLSACREQATVLYGESSVAWNVARADSGSLSEQYEALVTHIEKRKAREAA